MQGRKKTIDKCPEGNKNCVLLPGVVSLQSWSLVQGYSIYTCI